MTRSRWPVAVVVTAACAQPGADVAARAAAPPVVATYQVEHSLTVPVPAGAQQLRIWLPLPRDDAEQETMHLAVDAPPGWRQTADALGNRYVYVAMAAPPDRVTVKTAFTLQRREVRSDVDPAHTRPLTAGELRDHAAELAGNRYVVVDDKIRALAAGIAGGETNPLRVARKLYDWTLANVDYWVKDPAKWKPSPVGSSEYCLENHTGNCTDFHSLWTALARASGIPTRMKYGSLFKPSLDGKDQDASYHCWPESWFPGLGWIPNDVAVADIYAGPIELDAGNRDKVVLTTATGYGGPDPGRVDYYFGNLDARRVAWSVGRDLRLEPPQSDGPVNAVARGYVEVDGKAFTGFERKMTYRELR